MTVRFVEQGRSYLREIVIGLLLVAIVVVSMQNCDYRKKGVGEENQKTIDSLAVTQPAHDSTLRASRAAGAAHVATGEVHRATVVRRTTAAAREGISADSLARLALTAVNEAKAWRDAYEARTREAAELRVALEAANARAESERRARLEAERRASLDSARNVSLQKLALGLEEDANRAANCRLLGFIPCATRTQVAVVGFVAGSVATYALTRKK